jgi:hypothetical protein
MKKLLFVVCLFIGALGSVTAQGTLQFNRVLFVDHLSTLTVPAGKVWKVEGYWQSDVTTTTSANGTTCSSNSWHSPIIMNGNVYYMLDNIATGSSNVFFSTVNQLPFWAPAGTTFRTVCVGSIMSVIEFNVLP